MLVTVDARDSHTGKVRLATKGIDRCIAQLVMHLNALGWRTRSSCCGHGKEDGVILLASGLKIEFPSPIPTPTEARPHGK